MTGGQKYIDHLDTNRGRPGQQTDSTFCDINVRSTVGLLNGRSKPWKIRLPLLILHHKDLEKSSYRVGSDTVITQTILYWRTRVRSQCGQPVRTSRASWLTTTTSLGRIRHPPTYYTTTTTNKSRGS